MSQRVSCFQALLLSIPLSFLLGCGNTTVSNNPDVDTSAGKSAASAQQSRETSSVAATKTTSTPSPAASSNEMPEPEASPEEVCERFMKLLQSGNRIGAENLLSRAALTITTKAGLKLEPMGGPTSVYKIGDIRYATNKRKLAQVDCSVVDTVDGQEYAMDVTWQLHKYRTGWRISGVMLELGDGKVKDLLSFENIHDVTKLQYLADAAVLEEVDETRQAKAINDQTTIQK